MSTPPRVPIIQEMRVCPEHACKLLEQHRLLERTNEFRRSERAKAIQPPRPDYKGQLLAWTVEVFLHDDRFPTKHERHIVLRAHCFRLQDGITIGASGKHDPKELLIGDIRYRQLSYKNPACELCEGGDFIPRRRRFYSSTYRPCLWQIWWKRIRSMISALGLPKPPGRKLLVAAL